MLAGKPEHNNHSGHVVHQPETLASNTDLKLNIVIYHHRRVRAGLSNKVLLTSSLSTKICKSPALMLGASTQRVGLLAPPGVASSRHQLRGSKVTAFPNAGNNRNRSHHVANRSNNKVAQIRAVAEANKSASNSAIAPSVVIDNSGDKETIIVLSGQNRPGKQLNLSLEAVAITAPTSLSFPGL
jgi:hypothetical protein